jgi:heterodisulfide reductase subunit A-like polyferredoxin
MKKPVLVLGGGIAGIQASLDLAEMGIPAFIVENSPSIGGRMAQLDKTFPTNDCSACILAPKVTSCYNHPLVKTMAYSELLEIKGEAPDFTAVVKKKARFIDEELCKACNACIRKCPVEKNSEFDMGMGSRRAVYKPYAQAIPNKVVIDKKGTSPCKYKCPAHMDAHGYVALIGKGRYEEALEVVRRTTPFAGVLGRICSHPCEGGCSRKYIDSAVSLATLKRFIADYEVEQGKAPKIKINGKAKSERVAVIGSGPAGLNCAYQLALEGYKVTIFEAQSEPGGMVRTEVPEEKLEKTVFDREIQIIKDMGVEIICNTAVGKDTSIDDLREKGYDAFYIAIGAHKAINPGVTAKGEGMETNIQGVFMDNVINPDERSMILAIARGNMAAKGIRNYLEGTNLPVKPFLLPETTIEQIDFSGITPDNNAPLVNREKGLTKEEATREALRCINCSVCCECKVCEKVCTVKAIKHEQQDEIVEIEVSSVIFANGYDPASEMPDGYGYGKYKDVVTSLEYERILSASGPYEGHIKRPSDGRTPERIAFIQCVGSRDDKCGKGYCSSVCCMYAVKEAIITKEHLSSVKDIDIFYMDMRAYGKDFDKYVDSAKNKYGVGFIRSRVSDVIRNDVTGNLMVKCCDENGTITSNEYDMVVLSVGLSTNKQAQHLFRKTGVKTDKYGFLWLKEMDAPETSRKGILACGAASGPKDIPETVVEASAAASEAAKIAGKTMVEFDDYSNFFKVEEKSVIRDVSREPVRVGVFVCHCGVNIAGFLDVKEVVKYAKTLPQVEYAGDYMYSCSVDTQKTIADRIKKLNLNRVVIAACTPRTHEPLFQDVLTKAGINPYLVTMANIRDQCSWVHMDNWEDATQKAKDLVRMQVGKIIHAKQLTKQQVGVTKSALVIGGGVSGMTSALEIADMGYKVYLVEKTEKLGGNALHINSTFTGRPAEHYIEAMINRVNNNSLIEVYTDTEIKSVSGYVGKFLTILERMGQEIKINHGVAIIAIGARESKPSEYLYGVDSRVVTGMELEETLKDNRVDLKSRKNIFIIQCVGSRCDEKPYCSRVCCNQAIKNSLLLKEINPEMNITILYRDIRSYGLNEDNYRRARRAGVQFIRYEETQKPQVSRSEGEISLKFYEPLLDEYVTDKADMVILSSAIEAVGEDNKKIAQLFKVPMNQEGFFLEAHAKLRPVDFATEGVYLCGLAHTPKNMKESIIQGKAAAARAATVISKDMLETEGTIAEVTETLCSGCGTCEQVCPYKAIEVEEIQKRNETVKKAKVNPVLCKGCGTCSAACRCGAIDVNGFSDRQVINEIEYLLRM